MRPLTDTKPKPLLEAGGKPLIVWTIDALARAGFREIVVNVSHLGNRIMDALGDGHTWGIKLSYSIEADALETAGGIATALPLLGDSPFLVVNGDIYTDFKFSDIKASVPEHGEVMAHLVLIDNPPHHPSGDFSLEGARITYGDTPQYTFSGIGVYKPELFTGIAPGVKRQLSVVLRPQIDAGRVTGRHHTGRWYDIGTPERLSALDRALRL
jgi:MurNAc alpha-1-phosphate uridylyltransferase